MVDHRRIDQLQMRSEIRSQDRVDVRGNVQRPPGILRRETLSRAEKPRGALTPPFIEKSRKQSVYNPHQHATHPTTNFHQITDSRLADPARLAPAKFRVGRASRTAGRPADTIWECGSRGRACANHAASHPWKTVRHAHIRHAHAAAYCGFETTPTPAARMTRSCKMKPALATCATVPGSLEGSGVSKRAS